MKISRGGGGQVLRAKSSGSVFYAYNPPGERYKMCLKTHKFVAVSNADLISGTGCIKK